MATNTAAAPAYPPTTPGVLVIPLPIYQSGMIQHLLTLPTNQAIQHKPNQILPIYDGEWKVQPALIQQTGVIRQGTAACVHCRLLSMGLYVDCVFVPGQSWGCGNREFHRERTNCQLSGRKATRIAPTLKQDFITWSTAHVLTLNNRSTPLALSREAIRRVIHQTQTPNMLAQNAAPHVDVEVTEGMVDPLHNALTVAGAMALVQFTGTSPAHIKNQKYDAAAETHPFRLMALLIQEREDTMVVTRRDPGYIFMDNNDQGLVRDEIRDMFDRRFTTAVATAMGVVYTIVSVGSPTQTKTAVYLRMQDVNGFRFHRPSGMGWRVFSRNQRALIQPLV